MPYRPLFVPGACFAFYLAIFLAAHTAAAPVHHVAHATWHAADVGVLTGLTGGQFAQSVSGAGDVDADGVADLVVAAPLAGPALGRNGSVFVFSGRNGSLLHQFNGAPGDNLGAAVAAAGDMNGDGHADIIAGAIYDDAAGLNYGSVRLYSGSDGATLRHIPGSGTSSDFGSAVALGDIDGDGVPDIIVGSASEDTGYMQDNGRARVFSGTDAALLHTVTGDAAGSKLGHAVAAVGDVDGDGRDEFLVTAWLGGENGGGEAALYSGATGTPLRAFEGEQHGDFFGAAASRAGDIDGDGIPDLIIGAYGADTHGVNSGSVYLLSGSDGTLIHVLHGEAAHDRFGAALAGVGDANGDGIDDLIVGAARAGGRGSAYLYSGADFRLLQRFDGDATGDAFGHAVASAGDLNADGLADIIIGAPGGGYATVFLSVPEPTALALLLGAGPMLLSRSRPRTRSESANSR